ELQPCLPMVFRFDGEMRQFQRRPQHTEQADACQPQTEPHLPAREPALHATHGSAGFGAGCCSAVAGSIAMQSTGQGGMHNSQPVQNCGITVCISLAAPTIASTGQAWMHLVQPMQTSSSINAIVGCISLPHAGSS